MPTKMADTFGELDLFLAAAKDCLPTKPITTKHQSVFWLVSQSRRMSAIYVGTCRWISLAAASADPVAEAATAAYKDCRAEVKAYSGQAYCDALVMIICKLISDHRS